MYVTIRSGARIPDHSALHGAGTSGAPAAPAVRSGQEQAGIPQRTLTIPYDPRVPRPPLGPEDRTIELAEAVRRLGVSRATLHERVRAQDPVIRGLAPRTERNPTSRWLVSLDDVEAELRRKGLLAPAAPAEPSVDAMRVQMLQGALNEEKDRRIAQLEALLAGKDAEISRLRAQLAALGRAVEEQLAAAGRTVAAVTGAPAS